jgi:hypothetical protein
MMAATLTKLRFLLSALLVGAALAFGACGGDDDDSGDSAQTPPASETAPIPTGPTGTTAGTTSGDRSSARKKARSRKRKRQRQSSGSNSQANQGTAPKESAATKRKAQRLATTIRASGTRKYKSEVSYDAAKKLCKTQPLKDMRTFYKFKGNDPKVIARSVSKFYKPAFRREAAYNGCIEGLSQR